MKFARAIIAQPEPFCKGFCEKRSDPAPGRGRRGADFLVRAFSRRGRGMLDSRGDAP